VGSRLYSKEQKNLIHELEYVRNAVVADAYFLGERLREADIQEIEATQRYKDATDALIQGILDSTDCWTIMEPKTGIPVAMCGVQPVLSGLLYVPIWLLGTEAIRRYSTKFLRLTKKWLNVLAIQLGPIGNYVDVRNELHVKWLEWNGFVNYHTIPSPGGETVFKLYVKE
jgi:hypothetical protein